MLAKSLQKLRSAIVDQLQRHDLQALKTQLLSVGSMLVGGGLIGMFVLSDNVSAGNGLTLVVAGIVIWVLASRQTD